MAEFGLIGPAYTSESPSADAESLKNWYVERVESVNGRSRAVLYPRGGLFQFSQLPDDPIRGAIEINGRVFAAAGAQLCEVHSDGTFTVLGDIGAVDSFVPMAASPQTLFLISDNVPYALELHSGSLVEVTTLKNTEGNYSLDWPISQMSIVDTGASGASASESGNTVSVTVDLHSFFNESAFLEAFVGMPIILTSFGVAGYNGTWTTTAIDASNLSAVVFQFTNPTSGLGASTGDIEFGMVKIQASIGVGLDTPQSITVAGTSHSAFNISYSAVWASSNLPSTNAVYYWAIPPASLIGDSTSVSDGTLSIEGYEPNNCAFCNGYFFVAYSNSQYFRISGFFNAYTWDAADIQRIQAFPDNIQSMLVDHNEVWFFGQESSIAYRDSGDPDVTFSPILSSLVQQGCDATFSPVRMDNSVFWLGRDEHGALVAWRLNGYLPARVSNHAVEYIWQTYRTTSDAESFAYQWFGHLFWCIYFPSESVTWCYDAATGFWFQMDYNDGTAFRGCCHVYAFGFHLFGDWNSGKMLAMSPYAYQDFDTAIIWDRIAPPICQENRWLFFPMMQVDIEAGIGNLPDVTNYTHYSSPTLSYAASSGGTFPPGEYIIRIQGSIGGIIQGQTSDTKIRVLGTKTVQILFPGTLTGGNYRVFITGKGWQESYYHDYGDTVGTQVLTSYPPAGWTAGFPGATTAPQMNITWSNDNTHTWSADHNTNCPNFAEYSARGPLLRRLGRARKRNFRITCTDPVPWRIIDGYVVANEGDAP